MSGEINRAAPTSDCRPGRNHWPDSQNTLFTLEATGYALLALVNLGRMEEAELAFKFLNSQRRRGGGFGSTQVSAALLLRKKRLLSLGRRDLDLIIEALKDKRFGSMSVYSDGILSQIRCI